MVYIDVKLTLNSNKTDIITYEVQKTNSNNDLLFNKIKMINDYLLTSLMTPLRPFSFIRYNIQYKLIYRLFFLHITDKEQLREINDELKNYLNYIVQLELSDEIELIDVSFSEDNVLNIVYRLLENGQLYSIRITLQSNTL